MAGTFSGKAVA